jgi:predicted nucleotidyltransferase
MDIQKLLQSLLAADVRFLLIGAWAFPAYGYSRMTQDIDIFIEATPENARKTVAALKAAGYDVVDGVDVATFLTKKVLLREYILRTDIHPFVAGMTFDEAWAHRTPLEIKGCKVYVPSLADLIKMKEAAGRDKDKVDLEVLREIQKRTIGKHRGD